MLSHSYGHIVTVAGLSNDSLHAVEVRLQVVNCCMLSRLLRCHLAKNTWAPGGHWLAAGRSRFEQLVSSVAEGRFNPRFEGTPVPFNWGAAERIRAILRRIQSRLGLASNRLSAVFHCSSALECHGALSMQMTVCKKEKRSKETCNQNTLTEMKQKLKWEIKLKIGNKQSIKQSNLLLASWIVGVLQQCFPSTPRSHPPSAIRSGLWRRRVA